MGTEGFDFIADLGAQMPMRTIGMLLGIPEEDQEAIRDRGGLELEDESMPTLTDYGSDEEAFAIFEDYLDHRVDNPSDDLMSELLHTEFEDHTGVVRTLTRQEVLGYVGLLGGRRTQRLRRQSLEAEGLASEVVDRIRGPIGLDIGASTPAEIAVSVLAEVVAARRGATTGGP